jgi:phenylacetate-CoA ligase
MIQRAAFRAKTALAGRDSLAALDAHLRYDRLTPAESAEASRSRASEHARFAFESSPFYRELYGSAGITRRDLDDPDCFAALPHVTKHDLRDHFDAIRSSEATDKNTAVSRTGGSTGLPLHVLRDVRFPARALEWRLFHWWGVQPWDHRGIITRHMLSGLAKVRHDLGWLPSRRVQLDAFNITDETVRAFVDGWNRLSPPFLLGYAGGVLEMTRRSRRLGLEMSAPQAVAVTAAPLAGGVREEIETFLRCPVHDHYRSAEVPWIAGECLAHEGMHVFEDVRHVEILDDGAAPSRSGPKGTSSSRT